VALFSQKPDAIPIVLIHGWPGSILEFLGILALLCQKYTPSTLPYHVIIPSLPGFGFSSKPALDKNSGAKDTALIINELMTTLFPAERGYITQGGDIGARVSRYMASHFPAVKAVHCNYSRS
jgi:pimeloyl-ACP methyl ester carboxylesterase